MPVTLSEQKVATLKLAYQAGKTARQASLDADCSEMSAREYFAQFNAQRLPRHGGCWKRRSHYGAALEPSWPKYTGPVMIGKGILSAMPVDGWIGHRQAWTAAEAAAYRSGV
jgi:hypothetical protein